LIVPAAVEQILVAVKGSAASCDDCRAMPAPEL
jgi:hypothetical protein